ncbi:MAG: glutaredoxin family protein [Solirubrobacteraceae bacterium]
MKTVVLYTRDGCCLCDDARQLLTDVLGRHPGSFSLQERDIDDDDRLHRRYLERIPVITIDGQEAFELSVARSELEQRLGIVETG